MSRPQKRHHKPVRKSRFESETERRRREMLDTLAGASTKVTHSWLRQFSRRTRQFVLNVGGARCTL